ncbi:MAG: deoxyribose-phosphate aldolase [Planctomycetes bacterium]|jgi:deoxyribose-phosphate aldolase|nr:deoxyribose-phosphate aldolase [Planctomycetota bacterium]MBT5101064.1 deoxyribose-phosphate aldolase [Planctomycetota bacterium]
MPFRPVDRVAVDACAASFTTRSLKKQAKIAGLHLAISMTDLTTLEGADSPEKVRSLCRKAMCPDEVLLDIPRVAAVCVYPRFVKLARTELKGSGVHVASVATAFPSGHASLDLRLQDVREAVAAGADEIDMVIHRGAFLAGRHLEVQDEIRAVLDACGKAHLKVILETGELASYEQVRLASDLAMEAGAHFIKTSTGKVSPAATMGVTLVMLEAIRDYFLKTGRKVGMKPAGGIKTAKQSLHYLAMVKETLGDDWLSPDLFRFGASSLLNDVLLQLRKQADGHYQAHYDISEA